MSQEWLQHRNVVLLQETFNRWTDEIQKARCPEGQISTIPGSCGDIEFYLVEVKFDALKDRIERSYFKRLPISFYLPSEEVDKLRQTAGRILNDSSDFKRLLRVVGIGGKMAKGLLSVGGGILQ